MKRLVGIIVLALFGSLPAWGQATAISGQAVNQFGQPIPFAKVRVCSVTSTGTPCTPTTPIFLDYALSVPAGNPYTSDQYGNFAVYGPALSSPNIYLIQLVPSAGVTWSYIENGVGSGGGGGGNLSGTLTAGIYPIATAAHTLGDGTIDYGVTTPATLTIQSPSSLNNGITIHALSATNGLRVINDSSAQTFFHNTGGGDMDFTTDSGGGIAFTATGGAIDFQFGTVSAWSGPPGNIIDYGVTTPDVLTEQAPEIDLITASDPTKLKANGSEVCTIATGCGGGGPTAFSAITNGTNTGAAMLVGTGASLGPTGTGSINATAIGGVTVTGTPAAGWVPTATSASTAIWNTPPAGSGVQYSTGNAVFYGASIPIVDTDDGCSNFTGVAIGTTTAPIVSYSITGGGTTFNATYTAAGSDLVGSGTHQMLAQFGTSTFLNGLVVNVSSATTTTFSGALIGYGGGNVGLTTESGQSNCAYTYPMQASVRPFFKGHVGVVNSGLGGGALSSHMLTDFPTAVAPYLTATTSQPSVFFPMPSNNDFLSCPSAANLAIIEGNYLVQFAWAHQDGATVDVMTPLSTHGTLSCFIDFTEWVRTQGFKITDFPVITTATASGGASSITVASGMGIAKYQGVQCASGLNAHTYVTSVSGVTIGISPNTTGSLSATACTFNTGYVDHVVDSASVITNGNDAKYFPTPPHMDEAGHAVLADYVSKTMASQATGISSDLNGAVNATGPVGSNGTSPGTGPVPNAQIYIQDLSTITPSSGITSGGWWSCQIYTFGSVDYPWCSFGGVSAANSFASYIDNGGGNRNILTPADVAIGFNGQSGSGSATIFTANKVGISEDATNNTQIDVGNGAVSDQTKGLGMTWWHTPLSTAPTGSCTGHGGQWQLGADGTQAHCASGGGNWQVSSGYVGNGTPTFTAGTNVTSVVCASGYTCTDTRGEVTIVGGTATTGTIATVNFSATLSATPFCWVNESGGVAFLGIGHGTPSTSSFTVTAAVSGIATTTIAVDYGCQF